MNLKDFDEVQVADLWETYQKNLEKGIDEPYIDRGDYVQVQDVAYMNSQGHPLTSQGRQVANQLLPVVAVCKVATDLWYTTVVDEENAEYILYDDEIKAVYKLKDRCKKCQDCAYLVEGDDEQYFCEHFDKDCRDIKVCE